MSGTRDWSQETTLPDGTTQTITVHDESGRLTNVEINPEGVAMASEISNPAGAENVVLVPWAGGACDVKTEFVFKAQGQGLAGTIKTTTSGEICVMMAVLHAASADLERAAPRGAGDARSCAVGRADPPTRAAET